MKRQTTPSSVTFASHLIVRGEGEAAIITAALSTETPVTHPGGRFILDHGPGSIDLSDATERGLPLLALHRSQDSLPVGRIRNVRADADRVLRGDLHFSGRPEAQQLRQDVLDKIITDVSIGAAPDYASAKRQGDDVRIMRWKPKEASLVSLQADDNAGINRNEDPLMEPIETPTPAEDPPAPVPTDELAIRQAFEPYITRDGVADLQTRAVTDKLTEKAAMLALLDHLGKAGNAPPGAASAVLTAGDTEGERFARGMENALLVRSGIATDAEREDGKENHFTSYSLMEFVRHWSELNHIDTAGLSPQQLVLRAIDPGTPNLETSDFPSILAGTLNKGLFRGFDEAPRTWDQWCSVNTVADFKAYTRPGLSHYTTLPVVVESASFTDGIRTDKHEAGALLTYGSVLSISREGIINDDLSAFADNARSMGEAAQRTIDEGVYAELQLNTGAGPTMTEDATLMFDVATHANLITTGGAPDEAAIIVAEVAMSAQADNNSIPLGIRPAFSLAPIELRRTMEKLASAEFSPDGSANPFEPNAVRGSFVPIASHLITDKNSWYMMGARGSTMEVNFLNGQRSPSMERDTGWAAQSLHWKVFIDFDVIALDWRAAFLNEGGV